MGPGQHHLVGTPSPRQGVGAQCSPPTTEGTQEAQINPDEALEQSESLSSSQELVCSFSPGKLYWFWRNAVLQDVRTLLSAHTQADLGWLSHFSSSPCLEGGSFHSPYSKRDSAVPASLKNALIIAVIHMARHEDRTLKR